MEHWGRALGKSIGEIITWLLNAWVVGNSDSAAPLRLLDYFDMPLYAGTFLSHIYNRR